MPDILYKLELITLALTDERIVELRITFLYFAEVY